MHLKKLCQCIKCDIFYIFQDLLQNLQTDFAQQETGTSCLNEEIIKLSGLLQKEKYVFVILFIVFSCTID